jgi:two-component system chemotaxis response regulator CheB
MERHDIIVVGASAGGVEALKDLVHRLPVDLRAAVFVVLHRTTSGRSLLPSILARAGKLPVFDAEDWMPIEHGRVYVAPVDHHLLVENGQARVVRGPKENRHRPAIDPLFRSAAWGYGPRVVGVVLSGTLDDGSVGLWAIKTCGGVTVVQDPQEAAYPEMPANAMRHVEVDHCLPIAEIASLLTRLASEPTKSAPSSVPHEIQVGNEMVTMNGDMDDMAAVGKLSAFTCPACRGALWELSEGDLLHYRCHVGHAFSAESLLADQSESVEQALFTALRALEEKSAILHRMNERYGEDRPRASAPLRERVKQLEESANVIRRLLATGRT